MRRWAVGGRRQGEGLGGEQQLGRLVVPVETWTRWRPGSSLSSSACIHSPAQPKSRCLCCWQKARGCTEPLPDENKEPETYDSQDWFKWLQVTNDLIHQNGMPTKQISLYEHMQKRFLLAPELETFYFLMQTEQWQIKMRLQTQHDLFKL